MVRATQAGGLQFGKWVRQSPGAGPGHVLSAETSAVLGPRTCLHFSSSPPFLLLSLFGQHFIGLVTDLSGPWGSPWGYCFGDTVFWR